MPMLLRRAAAVAALLALAGFATAGEPETYRLDPVHTRVMFAIDHAGFSKAIGTVSGSTGTLVFDPEDWRSAQLQASVPIARVDLGDAVWNKATLARNLLNAVDFPTAEFVSTRIEPITDNQAAVTGRLTLHGVTREVVLEVTLNAAKRHPLPPFRRTVGFSATTTLSRKAFGIDAWPTVIGDTVELRIEAEAVRDRNGGERDPADATAPDAPDSADPASVVPDPATDPASAAPPEPRHAPNTESAP